ncbi:hypothetical protein QVG61_10230 [Thiohalobacter sp. IOR34]|uniref:hypothetical protein n=1 Tax=Thiohalobacter sp. IOR34 TaxID=3057176 RepID=UPI0025B10605|nr:hypothetical protein [Thiohalobacter sp. IOR34]WJW74873.1 hypothetical protein QVG61_10230 [Thiohalobacter sp. IOR34]
MKKFMLLAALFGPVSSVADPLSFSLSAEVWARPRQGEALVRIEPLRQAVAALDAEPGRRLLLHHPGGEEGGLWAHQLRGWLVALGVPSARIELLPGGVEAAALRLEVVDGENKENQIP